MFEAELAFAQAVADRADALALSSFRRTGLEVRRKPDRTLVTEADLAVETMVRAELASAFPDDLVLGEEEGGTTDPDGRVWVLDPIDGTANYARGVPIWATLLALRIDGVGVLGLASAPALGERYVATRGRGATLNGAPIHASAVADVADAHVLYGELKDVLDGPRGPGVEDLIRSCWRDRGFGDFWGHALVASGAAEVMLDPTLNLWDYAAVEVIVTEAGGRMTTFDGGPLAHRRSVLTTNGHLHDEALRRLAPR
ncbi:MAG: inositol monophosphatase family protein [Planctomycetaceae bacterium]